MTMSEIQNMLNGLMRGIDKKTTFTVELCPDPDLPGVMVQMRRAKRTGSLQLAEADLFAAQTDLMRRNQVRTALKRARDRMWEEPHHIFSTKVERPKAQGAAWFRPSQRGYGRR